MPAATIEILKGDIDLLARHEAAHMVVARSIGFVTTKVSVTALGDGRAEGGSCIDLDRRLPTLAAVKEYLRDRLAVLYAGVAAETVLYGEVDRDAAYENLRTNSKDDHSKIRELLKVLAGVECRTSETFEVALNRVELEVWEDTRTLVLRFDNEIEQLANSLRYEVREANVPAVIEGWDQPELGIGRKPAANNPPTP